LNEFGEDAVIGRLIQAFEKVTDKSAEA